jgi:hypothetical protein
MCETKLDAVLEPLQIAISDNAWRAASPPSVVSTRVLTHSAQRGGGGVKWGLLRWAGHVDGADTEIIQYFSRETFWKRTVGRPSGGEEMALSWLCVAWDVPMSGG